MSRLHLSIIMSDFERELTLAEKYAAAVTYGGGWFDDLDFVVRAVSGLDLQFMHRDAVITECPMPKPPMDQPCKGVMTDAANWSSWSCSACEWHDDHGPIEHMPVLRDRSIYLFHH